MGKRRRDGAPVVEATALKILATNLACRMGGASPNIRCLAWIHAIMFLTEFVAMPRIINFMISASRLSNAMGSKRSIIPCAIPHLLPLQPRMGPPPLRYAMPTPGVAASVVRIKTVKPTSTQVSTSSYIVLVSNFQRGAPRGHN